MKKSEIFWLLELRRQSRLEPNAADGEADNSPRAAVLADFPALVEQTNAANAEDLARVFEQYQSKTPDEQQMWERELFAAIGTDTAAIDETIHRSHVGDALRREIAPIQRIIIANLPLRQKKQFQAQNSEMRVGALDKIVCARFARQFVARRDLTETTDFDLLDGAQIARLIRLTGIGEVTFACARIEAVESVAAFLRRFAAEDARAIAARLGDLPSIAPERLEFAENLVKTALEVEPSPAAMLDLLGFWLLGIYLGAQNSDLRTLYLQQKLPLEFAPSLREIIAARRSTASSLQSAVSREIELLAATIQQIESPSA